MKEANVEELARRAVACKARRWMPGMRTLGGTVHTRPVVVLVVDSGAMPVEWAAPPSDAHRHEVASAYGNPGWRDVSWERALPDPTDPATLGCLLALVREAWGEPLIYVERGAVDRVTAPLADPICEAHTEAAALVAALEAAP